jgi:uncharacterized protein
VSYVKKTPFTVNLRDIVRHPGEMREHDYEIPSPEKLGEGLVSVPKGEPLYQRVRFESVHEGILVTGELETRATGVCGRCLKDIVQPVEVEFQELFAYPNEEASEYEVHDDHVDLEPLIRDAVVLSLPFQPVCRPDCPGLDLETGEPLAEQPDEDSHEPVDPRWAALASFTPDISSRDVDAADTEER